MMSKVSADCTRQSFNSSLFHTCRPAAAKQRSPNDDSVHGTATVIDSAISNRLWHCSSRRGEEIY